MLYREIKIKDRFAFNVYHDYHPKYFGDFVQCTMDLLEEAGKRIGFR